MSNTQLSGKQFVVQLNALQKQLVKDNIQQRTVETKSSEITTLVKQIATLKSRYIAEILELSYKKEMSLSVDIQRIKEVQALRDTYQELEVALNIIKENIANGTMQVHGVKN